MSFMFFTLIFPSDVLKRQSTCIIFIPAVHTSECCICICKGIYIVSQSWEKRCEKVAEKGEAIGAIIYMEEETHLQYAAASEEVKGNMTHPVSTNSFQVTLKKIFKLVRVCKATYLHS